MESDEFLRELRGIRRATTASVNALRADIFDLRHHINNGFAEMRGKIDAVIAGQGQIVELLQTVIGNQRRGGTAAEP